MSVHPHFREKLGQLSRLHLLRCTRILRRVRRQPFSGFLLKNRITGLLHFLQALQRRVRILKDVSIRLLPVRKGDADA
jgi:hypothetical protein